MESKHEKKIAVVLFQLGGPDSLESVEPFLFNLFCDPDIIDLPGAFLFRRPLARLISSSRAPKVRELYAAIGGKSPILKQTTVQADALKKSLEKRGIQADAYVAMRYWHPLTEETAEQVIAANPHQIVLLPLYPQYSKATTGSSINEWNRVVQRLNFNHARTRLIKSYYDRPLYIESLIDNIGLALARFSQKDRKKIHLIFSAHGIPMKLVRQGDPYPRHIQRTYELVIERGNFGLPHHLCYQSRVGPQKWLEPSLTQTIQNLAGLGVSCVVVVPIAFVTDHIETLSEINIEAREEALKLGIRQFEMMPALIRNEKFIACLTDLVMKHI